MGPLGLFFGFLGLTVVLLLAAAWTGHHHKRRAHVLSVILAVAGLGAAIYYALKLGQLYDLEAAGWITTFHLNLARVTTAAFLIPIVLGVLTWRRMSWRRLHGRTGLIVIVATVVTAITGAIMLYLSEPLPVS